MRHTLRKSLILLTAVSLLVCSSCAGAAQEERPELYTGEYFKDTTPSEHWHYVIETFITVLPHFKTPEELGVSNIQYGFGIDEKTATIEFDKLNSSDGKNGISIRAIPVFYGLLKEAQKYEEQTGVDNSEIAEKHGKKYAVSAKSVEDYYCMILRHAASVQHGSADGAEYVDGYYVFDELINPYQDWLDKGWELNITQDIAFEEPTNIIDEWGKCDFPQFRCYIMWYDKEGNVYNIYGEFFTKQDDPSHRLKESEILETRNKNVLGSFVFDSIGSVVVDSHSGAVQLGSPIASINLGTIGGSNAGAG